MKKIVMEGKCEVAEAVAEGIAEELEVEVMEGDGASRAVWGEFCFVRIPGTSQEIPELVHDDAEERV